MEKEYGIETLKKAVVAVTKLGNELSKDLSDDKWTWGEKIGIIPEVAALKIFIKERKNIVNEALNLSDEEREEVINFISENMELSEKVEEWINWSLKLIDVALQCPAIKK